jgi:hypothetical protein
MGSPPTPIATTPWPEDTITPQNMMTVPSWTIAPQYNTGLPLERWHTFREGQRAPGHAQQVNTKHEAMHHQGKLTGKQAIMTAQPYELPRHRHALEAERI